MIVKDTLFIGGKWFAPAGPDTIEVVEPATEQVQGRTPEGTISDETFCEVFPDDVQVPAEQVALSSLHYERQMIWIRNRVEIQRELDSIRGVHGEDIFAELGSLLAHAEALRATGYPALRNELADRQSPEADILKVLGSVTLQRVWELSAPAAGPPPIGDLDLPFERQDALAATIYGRTSEIQRNIIAERLLGLPKG